jgi:D-amino peptidase
MNIFIMADMEGISGITDPEQVFTDNTKYYESEGRLYMTMDVNACIEGLIEGGAKKIIVKDAHSGSKNLLWDKLSNHAEYIIGSSGDKRMPGLETCDGVILLGYHAMAGTPGAILEHTWSSKSWQNFWLNGIPAGEIAIDAGIAGDYDKPVIMVSGDDKVCHEASKLINGIVTAQVKQGFSVSGGRLLSMDNAHDLIRKKACEAIKKCANIRPFKVKAPVTMRLEKVERGQLPNIESKPYMKIIDGRTYEVYGDSVEQALWRL